MLRRFGRVGVVVVVLTLSAVPAFGQGTAASIIGRVTDQTGAVLPGVTVTATSPALQVPQMTAVTNEVGEYRLAPLPVGLFEIAYDLQGFQTIRRQDIRLTVGFTARVDVALGVAAVGETITVSGTAPIVDVTSTSGSTLLTNEILQLTATPRNSVMSVLTLAPAVRSFLDIGGGQMIAGESRRPRVRHRGPDVVHDRRGAELPAGQHLLGLSGVRRSAYPGARRRRRSADPRRPGHRRREVRGE